MSKASIGILFGFSLMIITVVGNYVAASEAYYQAQLRRLAQPCTRFVESTEWTQELPASEATASIPHEFDTPRP